MRRLANIAVVLLAALAAAVAIAGEPTQGHDYELIKPPQPTANGNKVEVIEFFSYACPHCNALQPSLRTWLKKKPADVDFKRSPVVFRDDWVPFARIYFTLEAMGLVDKLHHDVFAAVHEQHMRLQDPDTLFKWVASKGVDPKKFASTYNSFAVQSRTNGAADTTRRYDIPFTPAIVVDGRYLTAPSMSAKGSNSIDYDAYFASLSQVIALARKNHRAK